MGSPPYGQSAKGLAPDTRTGGRTVGVKASPLAEETAGDGNQAAPRATTMPETARVLETNRREGVARRRHVDPRPSSEVPCGVMPGRRANQPSGSASESTS